MKTNARTVTIRSISFPGVDRSFHPQASEILARIVLPIMTLIVTFLASSMPAAAAQINFLPVNSTGVATSRFTSLNGNGFIDVSHTFSPGGAIAGFDNVNTLIFPSQFEALFPGTGQVQGHLVAQNVNSTSTITFDLTNYNLSSSTVFGIWNITDEPAGQPPYRIQLLDASNILQSPTTFNLIGNQDNETDVLGRSRMDLNTITGYLSATVPINLLNPGFKVHSDAAFWNNIPTGTKSIIITGNLPALQTGDGVGYYFAEIRASEAAVVPEPSTFVLTLMGATVLGLTCFRRRRLRAGLAAN